MSASSRQTKDQSAAHAGWPASWRDVDGWDRFLKQRRIKLLFSLTLLLLFARVVGLWFYPRLVIDEGLWTLEAKDLVLFKDRGLSGLQQFPRSPLHLSLLTMLFQLMPPTIFSARMLSVFFGVAAILLLWDHVRRPAGELAAFLAALLAGFCFGYLMINRHAYLESGVAFFSMLAIWASARKERFWLILMGVAVTALATYKANALYLLLPLLIPTAGERPLRQVAWRGITLALGLTLAGVFYAMVQTHMPRDFQLAWGVELAKETQSTGALFNIGRFGIFPQALKETARDLIRMMPDVLAIFGLAILALAFGWRKLRDLETLRLLTWLVVGLAVTLLQGFQHVQYFPPMVLPGAAIIALFLRRYISMQENKNPAQEWLPRIILAGCVAILCLSVIRLTAGVAKSLRGNPTTAALGTLEEVYTPDTLVMATPEILAATEHKGMRITYLMGEGRENWVRFLADNDINLILMDQWETPAYTDNPADWDFLKQLPIAGQGKSWTLYRFDPFQYGLPEEPGQSGTE